MIIVRPAERADLDKIVHTHSLSALKAYDGFLSKDTLADTFSPRIVRGNWLTSFALRDKDPSKRCLLVAEDSERPELGILGVARCHIITNADERSFFDQTMGDARIKDGLSEIQTLYIHPDFQKHGIGKAMMSEMAKFLAKNGNQKSLVITLDGYNVSADFYQRIGGAKLVAQFEQNTAATSGAANVNSAPSKFNLWMFEDVSKCCMQERNMLNIYNRLNGRGMGL